MAEVQRVTLEQPVDIAVFLRVLGAVSTIWPASTVEMPTGYGDLDETLTIVVRQAERT